MLRQSLWWLTLFSDTAVTQTSCEELSVLAAFTQTQDIHPFPSSNYE
uniref:Uncharacterized protein n=1 Tax=Myripristis murdjan TaxID=586833 RepID=A0A667X1U7_9TELE